MECHPALDGTELHIVNDEYHLGFSHDGLWFDLGRAGIRITDHDEDTGAYKMMWTLRENEPANRYSRHILSQNIRARDGIACSKRVDRSVLVALHREHLRRPKLSRYSLSNMG